MNHHRVGDEEPDSRAHPVIALVGRPNVGKSTLFGHATGRVVDTANAPGTTVAVERRALTRGHRPAVLVDLPGTTSLLDGSDGIAPFWELLLGVAPDAIIVVLDATDLRRHLPLAIACRDTGIPLLLAVNLADEADERGISIDAGRLSQLMAAPVHMTVGRTGSGLPGLLADATRVACDATRRAPRAVPAEAYPWSLLGELRSTAVRYQATSLGAAAFDPLGLRRHVAAGGVTPRGAASIELADALEPVRWRLADRWADAVERRTAVAPPFRDRIARLVVSPWPGLPLFGIAVIGSVLAMMAVGGVLSTALSSAWAATLSPALAQLVPTIVPIRPLAGAVLWAVDGGVIAMLSVGIPYVLTFYLLLAILEDSGYLTSTAVLADRLFGLFGLPGRAAIPLLAATGCNVPAIYGTRVLATRRERLLAALLITLTPCSARSAVVIAALAPFAGPLVALGAFGTVAAMTITAGVAANAILPGRQPASVLALAPLRRPVVRQVMRRAWSRFRDFVWTATPIMLAGSFVLGLVYEAGLIGPLEGALAPVATGWLGLPPVAGIAIVFAFLRKELALQLLVVLAIAEFGAGASSLASFMSPGQLFVYAVVTAVSVPCVATLATLAAELGRRAALVITVATLGVALAGGGLLARLLGLA